MNEMTRGMIATAHIIRPKPFRAELLAWMRLRKDDPNHDADRLKRDFLAMGAATARLPAVMGQG